MNRAALGGLALALFTMVGCGRDPLGLGGQKTGGLRITPASLELYRDQAFTFDVIRSNSNGERSVLDDADLTLTVGRPDVIEVNKDGTGLAVGPGTTMFAAAFLGTDAEAAVTVRDATLAGIRVEPTELKLGVATTAQLRVVGDLSDGSTIDLTDQSAGTTYSSGAEALATVGPSGLVAAVAVGETVITVTHTTFTVAVALIVDTIQTDLVAIRAEPESVGLEFEGQRQLAVIGVKSDGTEVDVLAEPATYPVTFASSDDGLVSVSATGVLRAFQIAGRAIVTVSLGDLSDTVTVEVLPPGNRLVRITATPNPVIIGVGDRAQLRVTGFYQDGSSGDITVGAGTTYVSSNVRFATVTNVGLIEGRVIGSTDVLIRNGGTQVRIPVDVVNGNPLTGLEVRPNPIAVGTGESVQLRVDAIFLDGSRLDVTTQCTYAVPPSGILDVNGSGVARGIRPGAGRLIVSYRGVATNVPVIVGDGAVVGIRIVPGNIQVDEMDIFIGMRVEALLANGASIDITADPRTAIFVRDPNIADWDGFAIIGINRGRTAILAEFEGFSAQASITVLPPMMRQLIAIELFAPATIPVGQARSYRVDARYDDGFVQDVTSLSLANTSPPNIIDAFGGMVFGITPGNATLTVFYDGFQDSARVRVTTMNDPIVSIRFAPSSITVPVNGSETSQLLGTTVGGNTINISTDPQVNFAISGGINLAAQPNAIRVFGLANGPARVVATYNGLSATLSVNVSGGVTVTSLQILAPGQMVVGTSASYAVIATFSDGSVQDVTSDPGLIISSNNVLGLGAGTVTAQQAGTGRINASFGGRQSTWTIIVTSVMDPVVSIAFVPSTLMMNVGDSARIQLLATLASGMVINITFDPNVFYNLTGSAMIDGIPDGNGILVTALTPGNVTIHATFQGFSAQLPVTIQNAGPTVTSIILNAPPNLDLGIPGTYRVIARYSDGTSADVTNDPGVMIFVQNTTIFTAANGILTPRAVGTTGLGVTFMGFSAMRQINVVNTNPLVGLSWAPPTMNIAVGVTQTAQLLGLRAAGPPTDLSLNPGVNFVVTGPITMTPGGIGQRITGVAAGMAQVTGSVSGFTAALPVNVGIVVTLITIRVEPPNVALTVGATQQLAVIGVYSDGSEAPITGAAFLGGGAAITVTSGGLVRGVAPGQAQILVVFGMHAALVNVSVTVASPRIASVVPAQIALGSPTTNIGVNGANFINGNVVRFNGVARPTSFVSGTRLTSSVPASMLNTAGMITVQVTGSNGSSNIVRISVGEAPNVTSHSPTSLIAGSSVEVTAIGSGLQNLTYAAPMGMTVTPIATAPDGSWARFTVSAATNAPAGGYVIDITNAFGVANVLMDVVPATGLMNLVVSSGQTVTLSGTNVYNNVTVQTGGRIVGNGLEPLAIIAAGDITIRGAIDVSGRAGSGGFTDPAAGGAAGPGGAGGGGGGDGNAMTGGAGGVGSPRGQNGQGGLGAGTPGGDGGGDGSGVGAAGGCGEGGGGGALGGPGGDGGGDMGNGSGGPGGNPGQGSAYSAGTGGGGGTTCGTNSGGGGGGGGGMLILQTALGGTILIDGAITASGGNGGDGFSGTGGGGGGSGGRIEIRAPGGSIVVNDTVSARGGQGGNADFGDTGAGGSGGIIRVDASPGGMTNASLGLLVTTGGDFGISLGAGNSGTAGANGQATVTP